MRRFVQCAWWLAVVVLCSFEFAQGQQPYQTPNAPLLGAAWYPEQWPETAWERDVSLMQEAGFNVVRVGEFAWSTLEPSEGHYDLDWLERAVDLAGKHGLKVVIGTPTDAPPVWLTRKYPETLGMNADGHVREHGGRRQFNYADPLYRRFCAEIVRQLAQRFGYNPNVLGWQIDNEYTDESFDPATHAQFQAYLKARYGTLENLNARWTTAYWSQTYSDWTQIPMENTGGNPGLLLEHKHFVTATWRSYQQNQIDVLRPLIDRAQFITTNFGGLAWSDNWDHYKVAAPLDLITWDDYVGEGHLNAAKNAMLNDFARGWRRQNFWLMETQPGSVNWAPVNNALAPGETRALAWQAIGHGADAILYWQWRPALNGQEQYHGSLVGSDGEPLPIYREVQQLGRDLSAIRTLLAGTQPHAQIALMHTYDSRWAIDFQQHTNRYDQQAVLLRFYAPLEARAQAAGQAVDIIDPSQPESLNIYKLLLAPSLNVLDEALAAKLMDWVRSGGHLLLGPRSGMKDDYDALDPHRQPGPLAAAFGAHVDQFYALDKAVTLAGGLMSGSRVTGSGNIWAEALVVDEASTSVELRYDDPAGWLYGKAALVSRRVGQGSIAYLGTLPDAELMHSLLNAQADEAAVASPLLEIPTGVEACVRTGPRGAVWILINHADRPAKVRLPQVMRNLLQPDSNASQSFELQPQGVAVLIPTGGAH